MSAARPYGSPATRSGGPDERVRLSVTYERGRGRARTETKVIRTRDLEREVERMGRNGKVIDVAAERTG